VTPAELSQRRQALANANAVRTGKSHLKHSLRAGELTVSEALKSKWAPHFRVDEFLVAIPKIGRVKAGRIANGIRVSPYKKLGALSERQARMLREAVSA